MNKKNATVFLTVGTTQQKQLCEKAISDCKEKYGINIVVAADTEQGDRLGSGGALLHIIGKYYKTANKMLVINSGGQSKRSVNCAIRGKALANIETDGNAISLFEYIIIQTKRLLDRFDKGILVCCSDILINTENIDVDFDNNIGFCVPADIETGTRHGVMFYNDKQLLANYPHKTDAQQLRAAATACNTDTVLIDTGVIYLHDAVCSILYDNVNSSDLVGYLRNNHIELNFYADIVPLFAENCKQHPPLQSVVTSSAHTRISQILFDLLSGFSLKVCVLEKQQFLHFGSLRESHTNTLLLAGHSCVRINSFIENGAVTGSNTILDNAVIHAGCTIGKNCLVSDIILDGRMHIPDNHLACGIKLLDGSYVTVLCDIDENPKSTIGNIPLWDYPRFYKGKSFSDSLKKFILQSPEEKVSLQYCTAQADYHYYHSLCCYIRDMNAHTMHTAYTELQQTIIENHLHGNPAISRFICKKERFDVHLPVRVNFSGTWTDAMPYCVENGGQVINMAVLVDNEYPISVSIEKLQEKRIEFCSDDTYLQFDFSDSETKSDLSDFILHMAAIRSFGISEKTVLVNGFRLSTKVKGIDKGSGLGTSSILLAGCLKALAEITDTPYTNSKILHTVFVAEQMMGTGGGWQDQIGGLYPALKISTSQPGIVQMPQVQSISISTDFRKAFSERMILIPTGQRHFGRFIVSDVANRYLSSDKSSLHTFRLLTELNKDMLHCLHTNNYKAFLLCINRHNDLLKHLSPMITNEKIDTLVTSCRKDIADAVSVCGAGGGGYLLAFLKDGLSVSAAQHYLDTKFPSVNGLVKKLGIAE